MKILIPLGLVFLLSSGPTGTAADYGPTRRIQGDEGGRYDRPPNINGRWFMGGDPDQPCFIRQRWPGNRALFINEKGSRAEGSIRGNRIFIPDWGEDGEGQRGVIQGDRIRWIPGRSFWAR